MTAREVWARCICVVNGVVIADGERSGRAGGGGAPSCPALAPVANRTLLRRAVDTLVAAGADDITVVADRQTAPRLRSALVGAEPIVNWVTAADSPDVTSGLLAAADAVGGDRFLVHTTRGLWLQQTERLRAVSAGDHDALLFLRDVQRVPVAAESDGEMLAVATRPSVGDVSLGGFHAFSSLLVEALRDTPGTGDRRLLDAVDAVSASGGRVEAAMADGWWSYTGLAEELLAANRIALDGMDGVCADDAVGDDSRIEGRVEIHPSATVRGSLILGPVTIGADATVTDAYVGPYTAIGEAATIDNVELENSVVLTGARVRHVGVRLESSIIGQGASVGRGFELPRSMRLVIGEDARITLP